jgi:mannosyltransferase
MGYRVTKAPHSTDTAYLVGVIALGSVLRLLHLGAASLWLDEALSVAYARMPWPQFVHVMQARELNMLPYYLLLRAWIHLGTGEWIVRSLSAIFSIATLPLFYQLGVRLFARRTGRIGVVLLALNPYHIRFAQEARSYSLMLLLVTASTLLFVHATESSSQSSTRAWVAYVVTGVLAAYAHFFAILAILAHWASLAIVRPNGVAWKRAALPAAAMCVLLVPIAAFVLLGHADTAEWISRPTLRRVEYFVYSIMGGDNTSGARLFAYPVYAVVLFAAAAAARRMWRTREHGRDAEHFVLVLAGASLPIVLVLVASVVKPIFVDKYLMECLPFAVLLVAFGVSALRLRTLAYGALFFTLLLSAHGTAGYFRHTDKDDWRAATRYVFATAHPGDAALFFPRYTVTPFEYYRAPFDSSATRVAVVYPGTLGDGDVVPALSAVRHRYSRMWALFNQDGAAGVAVRDSLARRYHLLGDRQFTGVRVILYDTR